MDIVDIAIILMDILIYIYSNRLNNNRNFVSLRGKFNEVRLLALEPRWCAFRFTCILNLGFFILGYCTI